MRWAVHHAVGLGAAMIFFSGCGAPLEAELLEVEAVSPERLAPSRSVRVRGEGFPPGRAATVRFEGEMRRPGHRPEPAVVEIPGRAVSSETIEARFTADAFETLGGRGTLEGRVVVVFAAADGRGLVVGRSDPLRLDISAASHRVGGDELAEHRRAVELVATLGLTLGEESPDEMGLTVETVAETSATGRAGVIAGDRLVEVEGIRAHHLGDVLPRPGSEGISLSFARQGEAAPYVVVVPVEVEGTGVAMGTVKAVLVTLAWSLFVLLFLAPTAGLADWIARRTRSNFGARSRRQRWRARARDLPLVAIGLTALAAIPALDHAGLLIWPLEALVLGALALRAGAAWLGASGRPARERVTRSLGAASSVLGVAIALGAMAALGGTTELGALGDQATVPWEWTLFTSPMAIPALFLVCLAGSAGPEPASGARAARLIDDVVLLGVSAATTAVLLGGWGAEAADGSIRLARAGGYVLLSTGLWLFLRRARRVGGGVGPTLAAGSGLALVVLAGATASIVYEPAPVLSHAIAHAFAGAAAVLLLSALLRGLAGRVRRRVVAHRFA